MGQTRGWAALLLAAVVCSPLGARAQTFAFQLRAELEVRTPEGPAPALPLTEERLSARIDAQHAATELRQVFTNTTGAQLEGRYVLRATPGARVSGFAYYIGEERIEGEVFERQAARAVYAAVTAQRRDPAILEQTADGEFTFRVFPIQPGEPKRVEIAWQERLARRSGEVTYRAPLGARNAQAEVVIADPRARDVRSPTHRLDVEPLPGGGLRVRAGEAFGAGGELVLRYRVEEPAWTATALVHQDPGHPGYFSLSIAAPPGLERSVLPKDVTLVLDRSGSMTGAPIEHARLAAQDVVQRLGAQDRLNVIGFDDDVDPLYLEPRPATVEVRADALAFVSRLSPGGGTDLAFALRRAFEAQVASPDRPQVILFFTDGQSDPRAALEVAEAERRDVRVFTVGFGDVHRPLLSRIAALRRGRFTYVADAARIEAEIGHLYAQIARPVLVDLSLEVEGGIASRVYPRTLPDLFADDEIAVHGRLRADGPVRFVLRGRAHDRPVVLSADAVVQPRPWIGRQWAIARVDDLLEEIALKGDDAELRGEVTSLALAYDFVTPYTAFLAIPARELTPEAAAIHAGARAEREAAQARHADAVALSQGAPPAVGGGYAPPLSQSAPQASAPAVGGGYAPPDPARTVEPAPAAVSMELASRAGCASCAVAPRRTAAGWLALAPIAALVRRRWRRRGSGRAPIALTHSAAAPVRRRR